MANRQGYVDLRLELWLGLVIIHSTHADTSRKQHFKTTWRHQEGRNYARLSGHDASWTVHHAANQRTLHGDTSISRYDSPWTPGRPTAHLAVRHRSRPAGLHFAAALLSDCNQHRWEGPSDVHNQSRQLCRSSYYNHFTTSRH
jgi:hypothetical protein